LVVRVFSQVDGISLYVMGVSGVCIWNCLVEQLGALMTVAPPPFYFLDPNFKALTELTIEFDIQIT